MIRAPRRSVTRFFIPLIDVLILLFCIFLLMPFVEKGAATAARLTPGDAESMRRHIAYLEKRLAELEKNEPREQLLGRIEELEEALKLSPSKRIRIRGLQVDPETGGLYYVKRLPGGIRQRIDIKSPKDAQELIDDDLQKLVGTSKVPVYVLNYPQDLNAAVPTRQQETEYGTWFRRVELRTEDPEEEKGGE